MDKRYGRVKWGSEGTRIKTSEKYWKQPHKWNKEAKAACIRQRVFCASLADVFEFKHDQPEMWEWRAELFNLILETPNLDWLLLTKRPENIKRMIPPSWLDGLPGNIWIGASAENQKTYIDRCLYLATVPAHIKFLSMEPLLGPINLGESYWLPDWIIVSGESGSKARPMNQKWVVDLKDQCLRYDVSFFFKGWGKHIPEWQLGNDTLYGESWLELPL